jgi:hypothetical protein
MFVVLAIGCGDATCPSGSKSMDGKCVPTAATSGIDANDAGAAKGGNKGEDESGGKTPGTADGGSSGGKGLGGSGGKGGDARDAGVAGGDAATPADSADAAIEVPEECVDYDCGAHGHCEVASDAPRCACDTGFAGEHCESCEPGLALEGETCVPACEASSAPSCGPHGSCEVVDGAAKCTCEDSYIGDHCEGCEAGMGLGLSGEDCVPVCEADAAPDCGKHGACAADGDVTSCDCDYPYAGNSCGGCDTGFALQDDGPCAPHCEDCGAHGFCDGSLHVPACGCYAGYVRENGRCEWRGDGTTGGVVNGTFADGSGWTLDHARIDSETVKFEASGTGADCEIGAIEQTMTMPTREQSQQLVLDIATTTTCTSTDPEACPPLLVQVGSSVTRVRVPQGPQGPSTTQHLCLGDTGYGGAVKLRIRPGVARLLNPFSGMSAGWPCNSSWPTVNGVAIRAQNGDECPQVGSFPIGGFDSWQRSATGATVSNGALSLSNSGVAHVGIVAPTETALPGAALRIGLRPTSESGYLLVELDGMQLSTMRLSVRETRYVCLPDWALGGAHDLALRAAEPEMSIENIAIVGESRCGDNSFEGGFERPLETGGWYIDTTGGDVDLFSDSRVFAGDTSLSTSFTTLGAAVRFPDATAKTHAALSFAARVGTMDMDGSVHTLGGAPALNTTVGVTSPNWAVTTLCPGHIWDGQLAQLIVRLTVGLNNGASGTPAILLDDLGTSSSLACR